MNSLGSSFRILKAIFPEIILKKPQGIFAGVLRTQQKFFQEMLQEFFQKFQILVLQEISNESTKDASRVLSKILHRTHPEARLCGSPHFPSRCNQSFIYESLQKFFQKLHQIFFQDHSRYPFKHYFIYSSVNSSRNYSENSA